MSRFKKIFCIILCISFYSVECNALMYIGIAGGLINFKKDKASAIDATNGSQWPSTEVYFDVLKHDSVQNNLSTFLGYNFHNLDFEAELGLKIMQFSSDKDAIRSSILYQMNSVYGMLNFYANVDNSTPFAPFIGAGVGISKTYFDSTKNDTVAVNTILNDTQTQSTVANFLTIFPEKIDSNQFIFQTISGLKIHCTRSVTLKIDWRMMANLTTLKFDQKTSKKKIVKSPFSHNIINLGVNIKI